MLTNGEPGSVLLPWQYNNVLVNIIAFACPAGNLDWNSGCRWYGAQYSRTIIAYGVWRWHKTLFLNS